MGNNKMLKQGLYKAVNTDSIWDEYEITMKVKETEKAYTFELVEFKSRYSGAHIEALFKKSKRVVIQKGKCGHAMQAWSNHDFTFYPYQAGMPYHFEKIDGEGTKTTDDKNTPRKTETNADVIRRMDNNQLAEFISRVSIGDFSSDYYGVTFCNLCEKDGGNALGFDCDGCLKHWLDSPATDVFGLLDGISGCLPVAIADTLKTEVKNIEKAD